MARIPALLGFFVLAAFRCTTGLGLSAESPAAPRPLPPPGPLQTAAAAPASFRFPPAALARPRGESDAPIRLTASDGTGLSLVALEANAVLEPPLAFTELHLTFENPRDERMEGRFRIALPPGAALSRFAMQTDGGWQEGEVVEIQRARLAYEDFLHRRQDPALLEQEAGNEFSARVFPIPARGRKELIVSYSHPLRRETEPYVLPLLGLAEIGRLDVRVLLGERPAAAAAASSLGGEVSDRRMIELHKRDFTPDRDFTVDQERVARRVGLRHGNLAVVRVAADLPAEPEEIAGLYVLVDSSASRALGYAGEVRRIAELVAGLAAGAGAGTPLGVAAFDQEVAPIFEGTAGGFGAGEVRRLAARRPLGASDLHRALGWLGERLARRGGKYPRVLLVTDGVATAGETEGRALREAVHALAARGVERLDVLGVGGLRDEAVLRELTTGNLAHDGQRIDGGAPLAEIARRLTLACRSGIAVAVPGAAWVWPDTLDGVQPGDEALVYADLPADRPFRLSLGGRPVALAGEPVAAERPLLERAWAQARIERLLHLRETASAGDEDLRRALGIEVVELSVQHRVLSPFTALLVLETAADYARFGLDRKALADILTVGPGGLDVLARTRPVLPAGDREASRPAKDIPAVDALDGRASADLARAEPKAVEEVAASVEGGVEGGVPGGVVGGVPGGVVQGVAPAAPPPPAPRVSAVPPGEPTGAAGSVAEAPTSVAETIVITRETEEKERRVAPYSGRFAEVMADLAAGRVAPARALAESWSAEAPGDVLALLALGEAWEATGETAAAARAYGSLIDLYPRRADLRRLAGERLERLGEAGIELAIDTYRKAVLERPDHPSGHRLLAWALFRAGRCEAAFEALEKGIEQRYPAGRFRGVDRVLREDLGLLAAAWVHAAPGRRQEVLDRLSAHAAELATDPSLRFVLTWETDANDVDLHVYDRRDAHAYYEHPELPSGGALYADVTTGYGPECFAVRDPAGRDAAPYRLAVHYYSRGPMGYGMGTVQIVAHDGKGGLTLEPRPFVVMADHAMVDLGAVEEGAPSRKVER